MKKIFDVGLLVGRFNVFHLGHQSLADLALTMCDKLLILVGSAQESGTLRNPFSVETRIKIIKEIYPQDNVIVRGLPDLSNENDITIAWGRYLLDNVNQIIGKNPDLMIYGNDESREGWFDPDDIKDISIVKVARTTGRSATKFRKYMIEDNCILWEYNHDPRIHKFYSMLRKELMNCSVCKDTQLTVGIVGYGKNQLIKGANQL